ncbi:MAG TPA: FAD-dependent oxidoreductase, partial [Bacteroidetes bacterium]|nr:FAD-dependent oxidoreductase [Bacteroidota bacterium]HEX04390.1 FAD-dependent oxidoreductase [Bacteroidota bacterium]
MFQEEDVVHIAVIGGGVAGISAALEAAGRGASVTLYESLPHLGGRAAGVGSLDTGRHLVLSSYYSFLSLLNRLNSLDQIRFAPLQLTVIDKGRRYQLPFQFGSLGGQWAAGLGLITRSFLSPNQRTSSIAALARTLVSPPIEPDDDTLAGDGLLRRFREVGSATVEYVFTRFNWPPELVRKLGRPLALGIGNASTSQLSAGLYLTALNRVMTDSQPRAGWVGGERYGSVLSEPA